MEERIKGMAVAEDRKQGKIGDVAVLEHWIN
ncbi:uncharacterized protein G2W53_035877 [Senna tora]|uniref:Uncharacterized protein n=1 Tax=Senna tora TaxID=362788 RepID=A0A834W9R5_9FABA|nr:uncharacterized protein G2W53_035877 [Senna tora]